MSTPTSPEPISEEWLSDTDVAALHGLASPKETQRLVAEVRRLRAVTGHLDEMDACVSCAAMAARDALRAANGHLEAACRNVLNSLDAANTFSVLPLGVREALESLRLAAAGVDREDTEQPHDFCIDAKCLDQGDHPPHAGYLSYQMLRGDTEQPPAKTSRRRDWEAHRPVLKGVGDTGQADEPQQGQTKRDEDEIEASMADDRNDDAWLEDRGLL